MSKIERIKAETDGLDVLPELLRAAREGWETLSPDHVGLLKWYGLYAHNTGDGHFMMRVKVIQGKLTLAQVETMAGIAEEFGRGVIDCTTRQCFQIHWIRLENIVEIFDRLERVGMTTSGACGDITRNVVGCTLAGLAHDEVVDGYATSEAIHDYFLDNKLYSNLPRKYKVSVTGCSEDCARGLINDIALSGVIAEDGTRGFNLRVGGGLSTQPRFARWMDVFLTPEETPEVIAAMTGIFRDAEDNRKARGKARLKFLVDRVGPEALREELETRVGRPLRRGVQKAPGLSGEDHIGVLPQADDALPHRGHGRPGRPPARQPAPGPRRPRPQARGQRGRRAAPHPPAERPAAVDSRPRTSKRCWPSRSCRTSPPRRRCSSAACRPARARSSAAWPRSTPRAARSRSPSSWTSTCARTATARTSACTSRAARRAARSTRSPTSASRACSRSTRASSSRRWTSASAAGSGENPQFGTVVVKKVPNWELNDTLLRIFTLYETHHAEGETFRDFAGRTEPEWWTQELTPVEEPVA